MIIKKAGCAFYFHEYKENTCNLAGYSVYLYYDRIDFAQGAQTTLGDDSSKLPAEQVDKIRRVLDALDTIKNLDPLRAVPGYKLHSLSGDLKGFWSITVTGNYRIIFRFENENASEVNYTDYH